MDVTYSASSAFERLGGIRSAAPAAQRVWRRNANTQPGTFGDPVVHGNCRRYSVFHTVADPGRWVDRITRERRADTDRHGSGDDPAPN